MFRHYLFLFNFILFLGQLSAQNKKEFTICDIESKAGIENVHVFVQNSTIGTFSNEAGKISIDLGAADFQTLYISHLAYENRSIKAKNLDLILLRDTLYLKSTGVDLASITISGTNDKKWKKNYKKFRKKFIGNDKNAKKVKILNAEYLEFEETNGTFKATCPIPLEIQNNHLGYDIIFNLDYLEITKNNSSFYKGSAVFTDVSKGDQEILRNRNVAYYNSLTHFMRSTLLNNWEQDNYLVQVVAYQKNKFKVIEKNPIATDFISKDSIGQYYTISFPTYLEVKNKRSKKMGKRLSTNNSQSQESGKFGNSQHNGVGQIDYASSYITLKGKAIQVNDYGQVVNHSDLLEYGKWAEHRMAVTLPWNFKDPIDAKEPEEITRLSSMDIATGFLNGNAKDHTELWNKINNDWDESYLAILLDIQRLTADDNFNTAFTALCQGKDLNEIKDYFDGIQYLWTKEPQYDSSYAEAKALVYQNIDKKFSTYFKNRSDLSNIRLDEIVWGGVKQDGIPPLRNPKLIKANEARYLGDEDIVFGIVVNGIARAYPKRILAWHEMFIQDFNETRIAGVYCTLCGTVIAYEENPSDLSHNMGTSGFLYRSNKLMYDKETQSLWNTISGSPVVGPLTQKNIELNTFPVITTIWKDWKEQYPETEVLSKYTGYDRNYDEGEAYKDYFSTDRLMFPTPIQNNTLANKQEVLIPRTKNIKTDPLAISTDFLRKNKITHVSSGDLQIVIITNKSGASKCYFSDQWKFKKMLNDKLIAENGDAFIIHDDYLQSSTNADEKLERISSHRSFWFAWANQYPETRIIY